MTGDKKFIEITSPKAPAKAKVQFMAKECRNYRRYPKVTYQCVCGKFVTHKYKHRS